MRNQEGIKIELQKNVNRRTFVKGITLLTAMGHILCNFEDIKIPCNLILAGWHFYIFSDFFLASVVLVMALH